MFNSRYFWLLDPGHGGFLNGKYQTDPKIWKRSYFKAGHLMPANNTIDYLEKNCDLKYYEGVGNRDIAKRIIDLCTIHKIDAKSVIDYSELDVALETRVGNANTIYNTDKRAIFLSIHSDAFDKEEAHGFSVYTSPGQTKSDVVATVIYKEMAIEFPTHTPRPDPSDGDPDKEENFYVLKHTHCPAVLSENMFYTNPAEAALLATPEGRQQVAEAHFRAILKMENVVL